MEILSYYRNKSTRATATKKKNVEANVKNISAKFQLHPPMASEASFLCKFSISVAMATNQILRFGQDSCGW